MTRGSSQGFTLLEILIALAILATALAAGFRAVGMATGSAGELRTRMLADFVAQNRLAEHRIEQHFLEPGHYEGSAQQGGQTLRWREVVTTTPNPLFRKIEVKVYETSDGSHAMSQLAGFLVKPLRP